MKFPLKRGIVCVFMSYISREIDGNIFYARCGILRFCNKKFVKLRHVIFCQFSMMAAKKKHDSIAFFYILNHKEGQCWKLKSMKTTGVQRIGIRKCTKEFDMEPIIKIFDHLKAKGWPRWIKKSYQKIIKIVSFWQI